MMPSYEAQMPTRYSKPAATTMTLWNTNERVFGARRSSGYVENDDHTLLNFDALEASICDLMDEKTPMSSPAPQPQGFSAFLNANSNNASNLNTHTMTRRSPPNVFNPRQQQACYMLIDNSYMFIEGQKAVARSFGLQTKSDPRLRIHMSKLTQRLCGSHRRLVHSRLYGSEAQSLDSVWSSVKSTKTDVQIFQRSGFAGKEKLVDAQLINDLIMLTPEVARDENATVVILTGDQSIVPACRNLLRSTNTNIELYAYSHSCSSQFLFLRDEFPSRMQIFHLDQVIKEITFLSTTWDESKKQVPAERTFVVSFGNRDEECVKTLSESDETDSATSTDDDSSCEDECWAKLYGKAVLKADGDSASSCSAVPTRPRVSADTKSPAVFAINRVGRKRLQELVASWMTVSTKHPIMTCWRDDTHLLASLVLSEAQGEYAFADVFAERKLVEEQLRANLQAVGILTPIRVMSYEQYINPSGIASAAHAHPFAESDAWNVVARAPGQMPKTVTASNHCRHKFTCRNGLQCTYAHTEQECEFFKANNGRGAPGYKMRPCHHKVCKYRTKPHLCSFSHGADDDAATHL